MSNISFTGTMENTIKLSTSSRLMSGCHCVYIYIWNEVSRMKRIPEIVQPTICARCSSSHVLPTSMFRLGTVHQLERKYNVMTVAVVKFFLCVPMFSTSIKCLCYTGSQITHHCWLWYSATTWICHDSIIHDSRIHGEVWYTVRVLHVHVTIVLLYNAMFHSRVLHL